MESQQNGISLVLQPSVSVIILHRVEPEQVPRGMPFYTYLEETHGIAMLPAIAGNLWIELMMPWEMDHHPCRYIAGAFTSSQDCLCVWFLAQWHLLLTLHI